MADGFGANVIRVEASGAFPQAKSIRAVKYIAGATPSVNIRANADAAGEVLFTEDSANDQFYEVPIKDTRGVYVDIVGAGTVLYLYLEV